MSADRWQAKVAAQTVLITGNRAMKTSRENFLALILLVAAAAAGPASPAVHVWEKQELTFTAARAGFDGHKKRKGSKVHATVDTLGHLLALKITALNEPDRAQVADLAEAVQAAAVQNVQVAFVDQGYTGEQPAAAAAQQGLRLEAVKHHEAKRDFVLLPRRWVVEKLACVGRTLPPVGARPSRIPLPPRPFPLTQPAQAAAHHFKTACRDLFSISIIASRVLGFPFSTHSYSMCSENGRR
jgi:transposase